MRSLCSAQVLYVVHGAEGHAMAGHPERPERVSAVQRALEASPPSLRDRLRQVHSSRDAGTEELALVHPSRYVERLWEICRGLQVRTSR